MHSKLPDGFMVIGVFIVIIMVGDKLAIFHPMQKKSKGA